MVLMGLSRSELLSVIERAVTDRGGKREGEEIRFRCPFPDRHANGDAHPSVRWNRAKSVWHCDGCGAGGGYTDLARALEIDTRSNTDERRIVATYDYRDEHGEVLYQVVRFQPKDFRQRRPDGKGGWTWNLDGVRRVLYRLPELLAAPPDALVFIPEGERDTETIRALELVATTNAGGAGKWLSKYNEHLRGRHVVIIPDSDKPGRLHADDVIRHLLPVAASVRRVELPGAKDATDWLAGGHTKDELVALASAEAVVTDSKPPDGKPSPWSAAEPAHEFVTATEADAQFLDENHVLVPAGITELFSPRGLGKTLYALILAVLLASSDKRVLYINRDNPRGEVRRRLRACGVTPGQALDSLKIITRENAPPLTDTAAWRAFPIAAYDVVILDSFDSCAEGIGEQDSARPSRAIAPLLDVARAMNGPAVLVLGNTIKSAAHSRGSGVIEDRADIVFEIRDATNLQPTGVKAWWEELPAAGADAWASRATRRKKRDKYRLAFVPSKFRIGEEPDPFCVELDLSTEPWSMKNVTMELIAAGDAAQMSAEKAQEEKRQLAVQALRDVIATKVVSLGQAVKLLQAHGLARDAARRAVDGCAGWRLEPGDGNLIILVPCNEKVIAGEEGDAGKPHQQPLSEGSSSPAHVAQGPENSQPAKPAPEAHFRDGLPLRRTPPQYRDDVESCALGEFLHPAQEGGCAVPDTREVVEV